MTATLHPAPTALPAPTAARLRRPGWRDPRLLVGVALVAASVVLGATVVSSARGTAPAYVAAHDLVPGDAVTPADLRAVDLNLGGATTRYLTVEHPPAVGAVVTTVVHAGELVPVSAVGTADQVDLRAVSVAVGGTLSERVRTGAAVDVWFVPKATGAAVVADSGQGASAPRRIATAAVVESVDDGGSGLVVGGTTTVHLLVTSGDLPAVLGALDGAGTIAVVPGAAR